MKYDKVKVEFNGREIKGFNMENQTYVYDENGNKIAVGASTPLRIVQYVAPDGGKWNVLGILVDKEKDPGNKNYTLATLDLGPPKECVMTYAIFPHTDSKDVNEIVELFNANTYLVRADAVYKMLDGSIKNLVKTELDFEHDLRNFIHYLPKR